MIEYHQLELTQSKVARVDPDIWESFRLTRWNAMRSRRGQFYAVRGVWENGKVVRKWMHREIVNCPEGMFVDHINGDSMDNRRENLRICTAKQNTRNQKRRSTNTSGFKGVFPVKGGRFAAQIRTDKGQIKLGVFETAETAFDAYCRAASVEHGEFARVN